jgi:hypothetical protein
MGASPSSEASHVQCSGYPDFCRPIFACVSPSARKRSQWPTTTSAPMSRRACARSSSFRTIARTAWPCLSSSPVTVRPTAPTRPAAKKWSSHVCFSPSLSADANCVNRATPFATVNPVASPNPFQPPGLEAQFALGLRIRSASHLCPVVHRVGAAAFRGVLD